MALLPSDRKQQFGLLGILLAAGAFYGFWEYVYTPAREDLASSRTRLESLDARNREAQITAARGGQNLEQQTALYERHVRALEELVPASEEVPALLTNLNARARALNVDLNLIEPQPPEQGQFYTKEIYTLRVIGEYHQVGRFLTAIASMPRIITPSGMDMVRFQTNAANQDLIRYENPVQATFRIETYVLPSAEEPSAEMGGEEATS